MKAIYLRDFVPDPSTLQPSEIPIPKPSRPDEVLVRISHCSPQHADILHAQGKHQNNNRKKGWLFPPFVLGFDFAGVVVSTNQPATNNNSKNGTAHAFHRGDRVFGASVGAFAEYICVRAASIRKIPATLTNLTACAMSGQAVSYAAVVNIARVQAGETVLVSGASGGLGSVCCMVAKALGARVIALTGEKGKVGWMKEKMGVEDVVVMDRGSSWTEEVSRLTGGKGVEVVLDNTGMVNDGIRCLAYFGRIVILGFAARKGVMEEVKMNKLLLKSATVIGYRFGESGRRYPDELERIWDGYFSMLEKGTIQPILSGRYDGLESVGRALEDLHARRVEGKVVVNVADEQELAKL